MEVLESEEITILHKHLGKAAVIRCYLSKDIKKMRELATGRNSREPEVQQRVR